MTFKEFINEAKSKENWAENLPQHTKDLKDGFKFPLTTKELDKDYLYKFDGKDGYEVRGDYGHNKPKYVIKMKNSDIVAVLTYYQNGNIKTYHDTDGGRNHGAVYTFYENGKLQLKGWFHGGMRDRIWMEFDENGNLETGILYKRDKEIDFKRFRNNTLKNKFLDAVKNTRWM